MKQVNKQKVEQNPHFFAVKKRFVFALRFLANPLAKPAGVFNASVFLLLEIFIRGFSYEQHF